MTYQPTAADFAALVSLSKSQSPPIDPTQVALVLFEESGFDPSVQNSGGAPVYGLNQMSAANIQSLGLTVAQWTSMTAAQQLVYIFRWWDALASGDNGGQFPSDAGMILALNFEPGAFKNINAGSNPDAVLAGANGPYAANYTANKALDPNNTGTITVNTCRTYLTNVAARGGARWQMLLAGIQAAGGGSVQPIQPSNAIATAGALKVVWALVGGLAMGAAAHLIFPAVKPVRRRRYA
jgi:hypothetical protein